MRLDEVIPSLEEVQGMTMPSQDLAAIHALANKSSQGVSNGEIQPFDICSVDFPPQSAPSNCITSLGSPYTTRCITSTSRPFLFSCTPLRTLSLGKEPARDLVFFLFRSNAVSLESRKY